MTKVLYTSAQVRQAIINLFSSSKKRRVAITAFVGEGAEAYLPRPKGLRLICWPRAGGTNPNALRTLIQRGVELEFADSLHMKVYWTEHRGAVLSSANLSTNALGAGNLKEIGVLLAPEEFDIDRVISSISPRPWSTAEIQNLDREHNITVASQGRRERKTQTLSFVEWFNLPARPSWKLAYWSEEYGGGLSSGAKEFLEKEYGKSRPARFAQVASQKYKKGEWILTFTLMGLSASQLNWMFVDRIVRLSPSDKSYNRDFPYEVVQVHSREYYPAPPFDTDKQFRYALSTAIREYPKSHIEAQLNSVKPSPGFIALIYKHYEKHGILKSKLF